MSDPANAPEISTVQRWFLAVVTDPDGVEAGAGSDEARRWSPSVGGGVNEVIAGTSTLSAADRLAVYADAYYARLLECLRDVYPVVRRALGGELFDELGVDFLRCHPSRSYTLHALGQSFPDHLERIRPARDAAEAPDWADFIVDLARFEWSLYEVFDGPGVEENPSWDPARLASASPGDWPRLCLRVAPCLRWMQFRFPVNEFYTEARKNLESIPDAPAPSPSFVAISRRDFVVRRYALNLRQYRLLTALAAGEPLSEAIGIAFDDIAPEELDTAGTQLRAWFQFWSGEPFFSGFEGLPE